MKKDNLMNIFLSGFLKSFIVLAVLFLFGLSSYKLTMLYYTKVQPPTESKAATVIEGLINDVDVKDVSVNLIYSVNEDTDKIDALVLEIFNTYTNNLDYITIPANTQFTISNDVYQKLCAINSEAPQIIKLSDLNEYFDKKTVYQYGVVIAEDLLGTDISYYTVTSDAYFNTLFKKTKGVEVLSADIDKQIALVKDKSKLKDYISEIYSHADSNLSLKNKLKYLDSYMKIDPTLIYYHSISGAKDKNGFTADVTKSRQLVKEILANKAYESSQTEIGVATQEISSKGLAIEILNGSNISGLAATYQNKLAADGFTISSIGNNSDTTVATTVIYVKKDGEGRDLLQYFHGATIKQAELPDSVEIRIVLGAADQIDNNSAQ